MIKRHTTNEFYIKPLYNGYYAVIDGYDRSMASLECSKEAAEKCAKELNEMCNKRLKLK